MPLYNEKRTFGNQYNWPVVNMFVLNYLFARRRNYKKQLRDLLCCEPVTGSVTGEFRSETPAVYFP